MKIRIDLPRSYYPRSFLTLLLVAFVVVAAPLALGLIDAAWYVDQMTGLSRTAVGQAAQAARASRMLVEQATALERVVRQYLVLGDSDLLRDYQKVRSNFKATTSELSLLPLDEAQLVELNRTIDKEQALFELLIRPSTAPSVRRALISGYEELTGLARSVLEISNELIDREIENMRQASQDARNALWRQLFITLALGVLIAVGVTMVVARPIRQLDHAIRQLGAGELENTIRIGGPSDLEYLGSRLEWLRGRLAELEKEKRFFLNHISHELKTPLTALREGSELLAEGAAGALTDGQREIVSILQKNSLRLQMLIEDLLDFRRAQEALARLDLQPVQVDRIIDQVVETHRIAAQARGVRTELRIEPVTMTADAEKLRVVVDNLVSNAVKYSPDGGTISLALARRDDNIVLEVSDCGPGIPSEDHALIFEWFYCSEREHQGRVRGSGLGLAIAREFVSAHQGRIEVVSDGATGACFRVTFPEAPRTAA